MYTLGLYPTQKIPAEYKLPAGSVLILVDDDRDLAQAAEVRLALVDELAKQLKERKITDRVTTNDEIARIRQNEPNFTQRGAREIGQLANADTVIWLSVVEFAFGEDLEMVVSPAKLAVRLRVLNARAQKREEVRLWPPEREGRVVEVTVDPHELRRCHNLVEAHHKIAAAMAETITKLFYDQEIKQ
jgi:hypothetical protein